MSADRSAASDPGKPVPVESLLDEDDFAVIREEQASSAATTDARKAIARERETRNWTPAQWKEATPEGQHWPGHIAEVRREADAAVDELLEALEQIAAGEWHGTDLGVVLDAQDIARKALNG